MNLMETKKRQKAKEETTGSFKSMFTFFGDVKQEIKRITWTGKDELRGYTKIVVGATFALGLGIWIVDVCLRSTMDALSVLIHWIAG